MTKTGTHHRHAELSRLATHHQALCQPVPDARVAATDRVDDDDRQDRGDTQHVHPLQPAGGAIAAGSRQPERACW